MAIFGSARVRVSILLLLTALFPLAATEISYDAHCALTVPPSTPISSSPSSAPSSAFELYNGYFSGGDDILGPDPSPPISRPRSFYFEPRSLSGTQSPAVLHLVGTLVLRGGGGFRLPRRNLTEHRSLLRKRFYPHLPRLMHSMGRASFDLSGFYSEATGLLCMVGGGSSWQSTGGPSSSSCMFCKISGREQNGLLECREEKSATLFTSIYCRGLDCMVRSLEF